MKTSNETKLIDAAMIAASAEIRNLYPGAKGYGYNYVPLQDVIDHLKTVLPKHGLGYIQLPTGGDTSTVGLVTRILHVSGEFYETEAVFPLTDMKGVNRSQAAGAALTYFRRYALTAAFGITGDADTDMAGVQGKDNTEVIKKINAAQTLDELKFMWPDIAKEFADDKMVIAAKDEKKQELSK